MMKLLRSSVHKDKFNKYLKSKMPEVTVFDDALFSELIRMFVVMRDSGGVGIAANQVGINKRMCVVVPKMKGKIWYMVNPYITECSGPLVESVEGCLSFPCEERKLKRWSEIVVTYQDPFGRKITEKMDGFLAIIVQHEVDHLDGVSILDRFKIFNRG